MDFGNSKELRFFYRFASYSGFSSVWKRRRGGDTVTDFVTLLMRPKYLLKKSDRRCALTQLANKKYDSVSFAIRVTFEQV